MHVSLGQVRFPDRALFLVGRSLFIDDLGDLQQCFAHACPRDRRNKQRLFAAGNLELGSLFSRGLGSYCVAL